MCIGCIFPFITTVRLDDAIGTIDQRRNDARTAIALKLPRRLFFIDADIRTLSAYADQVRPAPPSDPRARLISRVVETIMSPEFLPF